MGYVMVAGGGDAWFRSLTVLWLGLVSLKEDFIAAGSDDQGMSIDVDLRHRSI